MLQAKLKTPSTSASSSSATASSDAAQEADKVTGEMRESPALDKTEVAKELANKVILDAEAQTAPPDAFVISGMSTRGRRIWHKVTRGPPAWQMGDWSTKCGWNFARPSKGSRAKFDTELTSDPLPEDRKLLCKSCFPCERADRKTFAQQKLVEQVGVVPA